MISHVQEVIPGTNVSKVRRNLLTLTASNSFHGPFFPLAQQPYITVQIDSAVLRNSDNSKVVAKRASGLTMRGTGKKVANEYTKEIVRERRVKCSANSSRKTSSDSRVDSSFNITMPKKLSIAHRELNRIGISPNNSSIDSMDALKKLRELGLKLRKLRETLDATRINLKPYWYKGMDRNMGHAHSTSTPKGSCAKNNKKRRHTKPDSCETLAESGNRRSTFERNLESLAFGRIV